MKKARIFSIWLVLVLLLAVPFGSAGAAGFVDVDSKHWASYEINRLAGKGVIKGYEDNTFRPSNNVTRAQAATMLAKLLKLDTSKESSIAYKDVPKDFYAYKEIAAVTNAGIMKGDKNGNFRPNDSLTRAQMAIVLTKAFHLKGNGSVSFKDVPKDHYAYEEIDALFANGITKGNENNEFNPEQPTTRAHFSVFLSRALDIQYKNDPLVQELKEIYQNEYNLNAYEYEGTMYFGLDFPAIEGLAEENNALLEMFKNIQADFKGVYQKDPLTLEMDMTMKLGGFSIKMPIVMTEDKMWVQYPEIPIAPTPEEFKGKFIEMDIAELSELYGQPAPVVDLELQHKLNQAVVDLIFDHFGAEYYNEVSKDAVKVPNNVEVDKVIQFEIKQDEWTPFLQKLFNGLIPELLVLFEDPEYAKALGVTVEQMQELKQVLKDAELNIKEFVGEIDNYVTLNEFKEYIAVHPDKYIGYDELILDVNFTFEGKTYGLKLNYKFGKSKVNEKPNFVIGIPDTKNVIKFEDLLAEEMGQ